MFTIPIVEITAIIISGFLVASLTKPPFDGLILFSMLCFIIYVIKRNTDPDDKDPDGEV
jgi:hypothetical protein